MRKPVVVLISLISLSILLLAACQKKQVETSLSRETSKSAQSPWKMNLSTDPTQPYEEKDTVFRASISDPSGQPVTGADVKAELKMQTMDMGNNEFALSDKGSGMYEGIGKFSMAGPWNVVLTAKQGDKVGQQTFQVVAQKK